jgi:hypothetical protein
MLANRVPKYPVDSLVFSLFACWASFKAYALISPRPLTRTEGWMESLLLDFALPVSLVSGIGGVSSSSCSTGISVIGFAFLKF